MMSHGNEFLGDVAGQFALSLEGCAAIDGKSDAVGDAEDVGIDRHAGLVPDDRADDIGRLRPTPGRLSKAS